MNGSNDIILFVVVAAIAFLLLIIFVIMLLFLSKARQSRYALWSKETEVKFKREILLTELEIREQTLKNISAELHDNLGQLLSLVVLNLSAIEIADSGPDAVRLNNSIDLTQKVVAALRDLSGTMNAGIMHKAGLPETIRQELNLLEKTGKFYTDFQCSGPELRFDPSRETIVYRIFQESMTNAIKHAHATALKVAIHFTANEVQVSISDNGIGFDEADALRGGDQKKGSGLENMKRRAGLVKGILVVKSEPSKGTRIMVTIPIGQIE
jgi:two-component system, NarL family, sensor kinase